MSSAYQTDDFQLSVSDLAEEFDGEVHYDVVARVTMEQWGQYRRGTARMWTAHDVADAARRQLRATVARRAGQPVSTRVSRSVVANSRAS